MARSWRSLGGAQVQGGEAVAAGVVGEGTGEPGLADAGGSGDEDVEAFAPPPCGGEGADEGLVEAPGVSEVDVLDAGVGVSQLGASQSAGHAAVVAQGEFAVGEQAEAFFERERLVLGGVELFGQGRGHAGAAQLVELVDGRVGQHR